MTQLNTAISPAEAQQALDTLRRRILVDGYEMIMDLGASSGEYFVDATSGKKFLDFYGFFASQPIGYNHPKMSTPEFEQRLLRAAKIKVANSDIYTEEYARFVGTFDRVAGMPGFDRFFFIDGGGLAVENALKAAFDWKVRKNLAAGRGEKGSQIIHFSRCFHGRTGYTMSLTDSPDPRKTMYFPKFDWPRIAAPAIDFALEGEARNADVAARETTSLDEIRRVIDASDHDVAAIIIETVQGEGGDNHFRPEFFRGLREICDQMEVLLIFDEVQCGMGITGSMWACEGIGVMPDLLAFGKKTQICGVMAGKRLDEVENVFKVSSRINSTWGGNLADMVRVTRYLEIIEEDQLVDNATKMGQRLLEGLQTLQAKHRCVSAARGAGLMCAFDVSSAEVRGSVLKECQQRQLLVLPCGDRSIRFRPMLDVSAEEIDSGLAILDEVLASVE
jgi:L-lysine 6-transaminase